MALRCAHRRMCRARAGGHGRWPDHHRRARVSSSWRTRPGCRVLPPYVLTRDRPLRRSHWSPGRRHGPSPVQKRADGVTHWIGKSGSPTFVDLATAWPRRLTSLTSCTCSRNAWSRFSTISAASVVLIDPAKELQLVAASEERARLLELNRLQHSDGPSSSARTGTAITVALGSDRPGWPTLWRRSRRRPAARLRRRRGRCP